MAQANSILPDREPSPLETADAAGQRTALLTLALEADLEEASQPNWGLRRGFAFALLVSAALWAVIASALFLI